MAALKKASFALLALTLGAVLASVLFTQFLIEKARAQFKLSAAHDECKDPSLSAKKENQNGALFVSCGGFLE